MSRLQITVACLYLTTVSLVTAGHPDVVFTVELSWNNRVDVVFSWAKFKEFLECIFETKHRRCEAQYDSQNDSQVTSVKPDKRENTIPDGDSRHMYYYQCLVEYWHDRLVCWLEQTAPSCRSTNINTKLQAFRVLNDSCDSLCVGLVWYYYYVHVNLYYTDSNFEFFSEACKCPTSLTTPSTQLQATSRISTPTTSFPASATAHSKSDSGSEEDTPLGFIVGVTTVVILIAVIVAFMALFISRRKRKQNTPNHENESTNVLVLRDINSVSSVTQNGHTGINCVSPYAVHSLSFNFGHVEGSSGAVTDNITCLHQYTKVNNDSSANETNAETLFAVSQHSSVTIENKSTENRGKKIKTPHGWASQNSDEKTQDTHEGQNIYRRLQNPHNTSLHPNKGNTTRHTSLSGSAHIPQTASQLSRYSFDQPIFNAVSNENADNNMEVTVDAVSANHTYYLLDVSVEQVWDGEEQNSGTREHKQNIYFDLEKREDISCSDVES